MALSPEATCALETAVESMRGVGSDDACIVDALVTCVTDSGFAFSALKLMQLLIARGMLPQAKGALALTAQLRLKQLGAASGPPAAPREVGVAAELQWPQQQSSRQSMSKSVMHGSASGLGESREHRLVQSSPAKMWYQSGPVPHASRHTTQALGQWGYWRETAAVSL